MSLSKKPVISYGWLRALTAFITFLVLFVLISLVVKALTDHFSNDHNAHGIQVKNAAGNLLREVIVVNFTFLLTVYLFRKFIDRKTIASLGLKWKSSDAWMGFLTVLMIVGIGTLILCGINDLKFAGATLDTGSLLFNLLIFPW